MLRVSVSEENELGVSRASRGVMGSPSVPGTGLCLPTWRGWSAFECVFGKDHLASEWAVAVSVAMWQDDDFLYIEAELPGIAEEGLEITLHRGTLFLKCERKAAEGRAVIIDGPWYGRFEGVVRLPEAIATDQVDAEMKDGVLTITLAKRLRG
jgi:HSP20 family molecular chaperone IbpA